MSETTKDLVQVSPVLPEVRRTPAELSIRLGNMREERQLIQQFFRDVMVPSQPGKADGDYGIIPGTDKPALLKPGAEKLCELYGYVPTVKDIQETVNEETGWLRVVTTIALVQRGTGEIVAEGVGECNTREARYFWRWVSNSKLPAGVDATKLPSQEREYKGRKYLVYRLENDDPWTLWNTVRKMSKKRAHVDATLSATRSSGIFTQGLEAIQNWIDAEFEELDEDAGAAGDDHDQAAAEGHAAAPVSGETPPASPETSRGPVSGETPGQRLQTAPTELLKLIAERHGQPAKALTWPRRGRN